MVRRCWKRSRTPYAAYCIEQIVVSIVKMFIKESLHREAFSTIPTSPLAYIYMDLVSFLVPEEVILRMKSTPT